MRAPTLLPALLILAGVPATLQAQLDRPAALFGVEYRSVSYGTAGFRGTKSVSEFAVPLGLALPLGRRFTADVGTYFVAANLTDVGGGSYDLSGLTDVIVRGSFQIKPDVAVFTVALNLPTGNATLDTAQILVAGSTATDLITYPVQNFGTGFNVTTGLALAAPVGAWAVGIAGSFRYNGEYQPFIGDTTPLQPGGEFRIRLGADRIVGQGRVSLGVTLSNFSTDEFGTQANKPGARFIPQASWSFPVGNNTLSLYGWDIYRKSAQDTTVQMNENTLALGAIFALRTGRNVLRPQIEYRKAWLAQPNLGMQNNGNLVAVGARYSIAASRRMTLVPGARFDFGSVPDGSTSVSFSGISASLNLRTTF